MSQNAFSKSILSNSDVGTEKRNLAPNKDIISASASSSDEEDQCLSSVSLTASQNFEKNWKAYMNTLIESGKILCAQTDVSRQQLCSLLHRQIDICNKIFLTVSMTSPEKFQSIIHRVTDAKNMNEYLFNQLSECPGNEQNLPERQVRAQEALNDVNLPRRRTTNTNASNPFEIGPEVEGPLLKDLLPINSLNSYLLGVSAEYRVVDDPNNPSCERIKCGSLRLNMSDWQQSLANKRWPADRDNESQNKHFSSHTEQEHPIHWESYQALSSNSQNAGHGFFETDLHDKQGSTYGEYRKVDSNESLIGPDSKNF